jgi:hypothetical protein
MDEAGASLRVSPHRQTAQLGEESTMALRYEKILHFASRILYAETITAMKRTMGTQGEVYGISCQEIKQSCLSLQMSCRGVRAHKK